MWRNLLEKILKYNVLLVLLVLIAGVSLLSDKFLTSRNLQNVMLQISTDGIIAIGVTFVIITAGIDLSVGKVLALASVVAVGLQPHTGSFWAVVLALLTGAVIGVMNGLLVAKVKINPFISTLGMRVFVEGLALGVTNTRPISGTDPAFAQLATTPVLGIPLAAAIFLVMVGICHYILSYTPVGRGFYAVGGNKEASWLAGIKVNGYLVAAYAFTSFTAALAGVLLASRINTGSPIIGRDTDLVVIAGVLLGGASMSGGSGTIVGTLLGMLVLGVLNNSLNLLRVADFYQTIITGVLLVLVMLLDRYYISRARRLYR
ncbi:MAG TPA: ABC transporter permease [Chloroflexi bacterium]|nr:ABC transporter permease [Chloroflexota bacterium]